MADVTAPEPLDQHVLVGRFSRYREAKRTVDTLAVVGRIPKKRITVLGRGLSWSPPLNAERAGRLGAWPRAPRPCCCCGASARSLRASAG